MSEQPLRVLQVVGNLDRGGGQEVVRTLVRHLPAYGVEPVVATLADGPLRADIETDGVPVEVVVGRTRSLLDGATGARELARIRGDLLRVARRHQTSVVQTHLLRSLDFLALTMRRDPQVDAVFWTIHNALLELRPDQLDRRGWLLRPKRVAHRTLYRAGGRLVDGFIAVSDDVARSIRRAYRPPSDRLTVIANGVDMDRYGPAVDRAALRASIEVPPDVPLAIVVAKLMEQKGHAVLFDALPRVLGRHPDLHVALLGEGELRGALESRVRAEGLGARVRFLGSRPNVPELLAASDLFVLPSLWEGLPMALLEAMASGLPVVATEVHGTRQVVEPGLSGVLVPPRNADALSEALLHLLSAPDRARELGAAARKRVEACYSARAQALRHAELYRSRLARAEGE